MDLGLNSGSMLTSWLWEDWPITQWKYNTRSYFLGCWEVQMR